MTRVYPAPLITLMSDSLTDEARRALEPCGDGATLIITVGNTLRADDGVGPFIGEKLARPGARFKLINAFDRPENVVDDAVNLNPGKVIIIDAANFGGKPGEVRIIPSGNIHESSFLTHSFPLRVIAGIIQEDTGAETVFLGIQPKRMDYGEGLSPEVAGAADGIVKYLLSL